VVTSNEASGFLALTAVGRDRPGIVAGMAEAILRAGANLEDATMTRLRGEFAMLLLLRLPSGASLEQMASDLVETGENLGLTVLLRSLDADEIAPPTQSGAEAYILRVYGADRPGIVHAVTSLLGDHALNITDLNTRVLSGGPNPIYVMILEVDVPSVAAAEALRPELERRAQELSVEIAFGPLEQEIL
jgi:glycine cleavage system transcriptional repressor